MIKSLPGAYIAMSARHLNTKVPQPACCQSPGPPLTTTTTPPSCLHSPGKLCISALGGKHYTGLAQSGVSLNILSWPLAVILLMARVSSSTFIRTSAEGEARERKRERARESCFFIPVKRNTKKAKRNQNVSRPADVFQCEPKMLPHSSSICDFYHFDDTKENQRLFLIARPL